LLALAALAGSSSSSSSEATAAAAAAALPGSSRQITDDTLLDITDLNAQVLVEDDALLGLQTAAAAAAAADGSDGGSAPGLAEPRTLVGIWPELNLLPHSCSPNTSVIAHKVSQIRPTLATFSLYTCNTCCHCQEIAAFGCCSAVLSVC
jgi:hypothetical protein